MLAYTKSNNKGVNIMKNKLIICLISFLVVFVSISGCINTDSSDNSANNINSNYQDSDSKSSASASSSSSGSQSTSSDDCPECGGTGTVSCYNTVTGGPTCYGTGVVQGGSTEGQVCRVCDGTGVIPCPLL